MKHLAWRRTATGEIICGSPQIASPFVDEVQVVERLTGYYPAVSLAQPSMSRRKVLLMLSDLIETQDGAAGKTSSIETNAKCGRWNIRAAMQSRLAKACSSWCVSEVISHSRYLYGDFSDGQRERPACPGRLLASRFVLEAVLPKGRRWRLNRTEFRKSQEESSPEV